MPGPISDALFVQLTQGERLLHGVFGGSAPVELSQRLPLTGVSLALLRNHASPAAAAFAGAALAAAPVALCFELGRCLGGTRAGILALLLTPWPLLAPGLDESSLYLTTVLAVAVWLARLAQAPSAAAGAGLGAALAASLLCRSPLFLLPPVLAAAALARRKLRPDPYRAGLLTAAAIPIAAMLPWVVLNWRLWDRFVLFEVGRADPLLVMAGLGLTYGVDGDQYGLAGVLPGEAKSWAVRQMLTHPLRTVWAIARRLWYALSLHAILSLGAIAGAWVSRRAAGPAAVAALAGGFVLLHCLLAVIPRYFDPVWPLAAALAAAGLMRRVRPRAAGSLSMGGPALAWIGLAPCALLAALSWAVILRSAAFGDRPKTPTEPWLWHLEGRRLLKAGQAAQARDALARATGAQAPPQAWLDYAWALAVARDGSVASALRRVIPEVNPNLTMSAHLIDGFSQFESGRRAAAAERISEALFLSDTYLPGVFGPPSEEVRETTKRMVELKSDLASPVAERLLEAWPEPRRDRLLAFFELQRRQPRARRAARPIEPPRPAEPPRVVAPRAARPMQRARPEGIPFEPPTRALYLIRAARFGARVLPRRVIRGALRLILNPDSSPRERHEAALLYQTLGELDAAGGLLDGLIAQSPTRARYHSDRGVIFALKRDWDEAERELRTALRLDPSWLPALRTLEYVRESRAVPTAKRR